MNNFDVFKTGGFQVEFVENGIQVRQEFRTWVFTGLKTFNAFINNAWHSQCEYSIPSQADLDALDAGRSDD